MHPQGRRVFVFVTTFVMALLYVPTHRAFLIEDLLVFLTHVFVPIWQQNIARVI